MSLISDEKIIGWIKNKNYSKLVFLEQSWLSSENELYLGFYYFIRSFKREGKEEIFNAIVSRFNCESSAYCYLGDTAKDIFNSFDTNHIPASFYRKSIALSKNNSDAHWGLYLTSRNMTSCVKSLKCDYENECFSTLEMKINDIYPLPNEMTALSREDWLIIRKIALDERVSTREYLLSNLKQMLLLAYFYLDEFDLGVALIGTMSNVNLKVINIYFERKLIDKNGVLSKIYDFEVDEFLGNDHKRIYQECVKQYNNGNLDLVPGTIVQKAFRAEEFQDVVEYLDTDSLSDVLNSHNIDTCLYYLLAQLYLNQKIDTNALNIVSKKANLIVGKSNALFQAIGFKQRIQKLEHIFKESKQINNSIDGVGIYKEAVNILNNKYLLKHFLYEQLNNELHSLKNKWNESYCQNQLIEMKLKISNESVGIDDLLQLYNLGIECGEYAYIIKSIMEFHKTNKPTIESYNSLGVCYENQGESRKAFEQYKHALALMHESMEYNHVIISNYYNCAKKISNVEITQNEFVNLKDEFNTTLVGQFKWHVFTAKRNSSLFKYSPFNINAIDALTNQYFYLAGKSQLNDPIELPELDWIGPEHLMDSNYRICSFSNNNNSMLMWSHYAQEHQGIMVEYWFGGEFPDGFGIEKVRYTDDFKRNKEKDLYLFNQYILTKNKEWSYENEVRLFSNKGHKVGFESFDYPDHNQTKINARISSITLGYKFPEDKKKLIMNIVTLINNKKASHEPKVLLKEAYISNDNNFSLEYRKVTTI